MSDSSTPRLFGTDGVRGAFGTYPLDQPTVLRLGRSLADLLRRDGGERPTVVLGGDTRESTPTICRWLAAALNEGGVACEYAGTVPTPAVAWLTRNLGASCGIAVSASHNPAPDNGIKLIGPDGFKWSRAWEMELEKGILEGGDPAVDLDGAGPEPQSRWAAAYLDSLAATVEGERPLAGLAVALDAGNGAASAFAAQLFESLGARVRLVHAAPNGRNINDGCGSTHPEVVAREVIEGCCDLGFAFDGDADRVIVADETGTVRDGDAVLYLWATALHARHRLAPPAIVATSMSNLGLERALAAAGIGLERCGVGDRVVVETLRGQGLALGGEQSGHIVHLGLSTTGDGMLTALQVAALRSASRRPLSAMLEGFRRYPQILKNVRVREKQAFEELPGVREAARSVENELGEDGRLVLRYSGTEPLARIMIEGPEQASIEAMAGRIARAIEEELA